MTQKRYLMIRHRAGLTLLEVVMAMFIFLISSIAIWQLVSMGSDRAMDIRQETRTSMRCQSKLAECIIGAQELTSADYTPFEDEDGKDLQWKLDIEPGPGNGLFLVKVAVKKEFSTGRFIESTLAQLVLDPSIRGSSLDRAKLPETATPTTDPNATPAEVPPTNPPTESPPTASPPTASPPTASPPTASPPTASPPTASPPTANPPAKSRGS